MTTDAGSQALPVTPPSRPAGKAGRNLPAAIAIGLALGALVVVSVFTQRLVFVGVVAAAVMIAVYELGRALRPQSTLAAGVPMILGAGAVVFAAYEKGAEALVVATSLVVIGGLVITAVANDRDQLRGMAANAFVATYVACMAGFAALLVVPADGPRRVLAFFATVVCSDTGGYAVGVFLGKHPMAPSVSPKKSWEGFGGSAAACALCAGLLFPLTLHAAWWQGVVFGLAVVVAATIGDLSESLVKRDLGIKDMGNLLPGHGGIMDRLDSLLLAAPVAWALLTALVPWPH